MEHNQIIEDLTQSEDPERLKKQITIHKDAYSATKGTHAIVLCTEWDEFMVCNIIFETDNNNKFYI